MIKGTCLICGMKKNRFVKNECIMGSGYLKDAIGKLCDLDIEHHLAADKGKNVPNESLNNSQKYSYVGPERSIYKEIERAISALTN